jgi:hypothetical protein
LKYSLSGQKIPGLKELLLLLYTCVDNCYLSSSLHGLLLGKRLSSQFAVLQVLQPSLIAVIGLAASRLIMHNVGGFKSLCASHAIRLLPAKREAAAGEIWFRVLFFQGNQFPTFDMSY